MTTLASAEDALRLSLHVLAAAVWVGGQITLAGLLGTARKLGSDAPKRLARAFARVSWPAYAVLVLTGVWNISVTQNGATNLWKIVLNVKLAIVVLAGVSVWLHSHARSRRGVALWGAVGSLSSLAALVLGVLLAG